MMMIMMMVVVVFGDSNSSSRAAAAGIDLFVVPIPIDSINTFYATVFSVADWLAGGHDTAQEQISDLISTRDFQIVKSR